MNAYELPVWQMSVDEVKALIETNRQQADQIEHYKNKAEALDKRELELLAEIKELEKKLQESAMDYISICSQADEHYARVQKLEQVLHAIANDYHELSDHKIEVQVRNHKKWARDVLSLSGNNDEDIDNTSRNLQNGKE